MKPIPLSKVFTLIEPGPVVLITTHDGKRVNIMTLSWITVRDFTPEFIFVTGPWNHSCKALLKNKECVVSIPGADLLTKTVQIGAVSGADTDKFAKFKLTPLPAAHVRAPLIKEALANIECRVVKYIKEYDIFVVEALAAWQGAGKDRRTFHAVGDGTFTLDGRHIKTRRKIMQAAGKLPDGV